MRIVTEALHDAPFAVHAIEAAIERADPQSAAAVLEHLRDEIAGQGCGAARGMRRPPRAGNAQRNAVRGPNDPVR